MSSHSSVSPGHGTFAARHPVCYQKMSERVSGSQLHVIIAHAPFSKDRELIKVKHPNDFRIRRSDDLHVKILRLEIEILGKYRGRFGQLANMLGVDKRVQ